MEVRGRVAIVTGASRGIGRATAVLLAGRGAKVALAARSVELLRQLQIELPDSRAFPVDMRDPAGVRSMIAAVADHYGRIDILVNNAGQGLHLPVERVDLGDYERVIQLNIFGPLVAMQAVLPLMRQQGVGVIVNVSSMTSKMTIPGLAAYASTKYALNALSLTARKEWEGDHISVCVVYPRRTATDFGRNAVRGGQVPPPPSPARPGDQPIDTAEMVAERILDAIVSERAETFMSETPGA